MIYEDLCITYLELLHSIAYTIDRIWIGASDILNEGQWVWVSDGSNLTFSSWNYNEPNNSGTGGEDCAVVKQTDMGWNDTPCGLINQYVCKKYVYVLIYYINRTTCVITCYNNE